MDDKITAFLERIGQLEAQLEAEFQRKRQGLEADFEARKVRFEVEVLAQQEGVQSFV